MEALHRMPDGDVILPFVLQFYGRPSTHLWEDEEGVVREIQQGEGGEQGDPLMPALFVLGQHQVQEIGGSSRDVARCGPVRNSSFSWTTFTSLPCQPESPLLRSRWRTSFGGTRGSQSIRGKIMCGTGPERHPLIASTFSLMQMASPVVCGAETTIFPRKSRASPFSALHWGTQTSCKVNLMKKLKNMEFFWTESPKSPISSVLGSCSCCAPRPEQITCSGLSILCCPSDSRRCMMLGSGSASKRSCAFLSHSTCGKWQVFHLLWEVCA